MKKEIRRCTTCILSASFPNVKFDDKGVCNFCRDEMYFTIEDKAIEKAKIKIERLIEEKKGKHEYDAVLCYSGGKDSTYTLQLAVEKYGLKILSFTLDNGFLSDLAFANINRVVDTLGIDHFTYKPSGKFLKQVFKYSYLKQIYNPKSLTRISEGCNSCISLINIMALKLSIEKNAPFIVAGFTLGQIPHNAMLFKNNYKFFLESREKSLKELRKYVGDQVDDYYCIRDSVLSTVKQYPYNINFLCLEDITEDEIIKKVSKIGWIKPKDVDGCSSNCKLNTFNNYVHQLKYGYNPYELELSHLIRKKQLSREEAIEKVNDQPEELILPTMQSMGINLKEIEELAKRY